MMSSNLRAWIVVAAAAVLGFDLLAAQAARTTPTFDAHDPVTFVDDTVGDASGFKNVELSDTFDLLENTFGSPGDATATRALDVNTLDEVPDSSWFTNRIGVRPMPIRELVRGGNKFDPAEAREWDRWVVIGGKGPGGRQPGFRAERPGDPGQMYQLEVDPPAYPRLATGAEMIGSLIYHALGFSVEDVYVLTVDPRNITISEKATIRDASGRRRFTRQDLENVLRVGAKDAQGRVYLSATRFDGDDVGHFEYYGTRTDDPNDRIPHEHRRELRANRVFSAWLAHDDSRGVNTRNVRVKADGRTYIRHHIRDFGAILGSSTRDPDTALSGHEYYIEKKSSLQRLFTLGLIKERRLRLKVPHDLPPSVGLFESESFEPERWKPNYPNRAFSNMQPDDAFWGARLVSRFSDEAIQAIVEQGGYDDPEAVRYLSQTLSRRRDLIARTWLTAVNPIAEVSLDPSGVLTFANAAVDARIAGHGTYTIAWARFDNDSGATEPIAVEKQQTPRGTAPAVLLSNAQYIAATIWSEHPEYPAWGWPVHVYFKRDGAQWKTVGLVRESPAGDRETRN
jgi:hypothetical protein